MDAEQLREKIERERVLRKTVLTAIERFTDTVSVEEMLQTVSTMRFYPPHEQGFRANKKRQRRLHLIAKCLVNLTTRKIQISYR